jgi:protein-disulfide isomerase
VADYKGEVAWVYRHYPIKELHSKAPKQSEAVECAFEIGGEDGFWKLTDKIYEVTPTNNGLNMDDLPKLASGVGINESRFKTCLDSGKYADKVAKQMAGGAAAGVTGTPGNFIVNSKGEVWLIPGAVPLESVKVIIDEAMKTI